MKTENIIHLANELQNSLRFHSDICMIALLEYIGDCSIRVNLQINFGCWSSLSDPLSQYMLLLTAQWQNIQSSKTIFFNGMLIYDKYYF